MKKRLISILAFCAIGVIAAQNSALTIRDVRDPVKLRSALNSNATDVESRLIAAAITNGIATMEGGATLDNTTSAAELNITETAVKLTANTTVTGTLGVTGVATFTAAPVFVSTNDQNNITLTMTNAPTAADAGKATPIYINVTIDGTACIMVAWPLTE